MAMEVSLAVAPLEASLVEGSLRVVPRVASLLAVLLQLKKVTPISVENQAGPSTVFDDGHKGVSGNHVHWPSENICLFCP
jgi:hypothetical protein